MVVNEMKYLLLELVLNDDMKCNCYFFILICVF